MAAAAFVIGGDGTVLVLLDAAGELLIGVARTLGDVAPQDDISPVLAWLNATGADDEDALVRSTSLASRQRRMAPPQNSDDATPSEAPTIAAVTIIAS